MEAVSSFETPVNFFETIRLNIPYPPFRGLIILNWFGWYEKYIAYKIWVRKPEAKTTSRQEGVTKVDFKEMECKDMDWIRMVQWRAHVIVGMNHLST
jgi:hypothetical protein